MNRVVKGGGYSGYLGTIRFESSIVSIARMNVSLFAGVLLM